MSDPADNQAVDRIDDIARQPIACVWTAFRAPWLALFGPSRAAATMVRSRQWAVMLAFAIHSGLLAGVMVAISLWYATTQYRVFQVAGEPPSTSQRSFAQVWREWHRDGPIGPAERILVGVFIAVVALAGLCAWTYLASVHKSGSVKRSFYRAFCAVSACVVILLLCLLAVGTILTLAESRWSPVNLAAAVAPASVPVGICIVLWTVSRAVRGVAGDAPKPDGGPRCERCGYDLTYVGQDRRCPECGTDTDESLSPDRWRRACAWEKRGGMIGWLVTSLAVLLGPKRFYARLRLHTPDEPPRAFAAWHFCWMIAGAGAWAMVLLTIIGSPIRSDFIVIPLMLAAATACMAWGVRRLSAGLASTWILYDRTLPRFGLMERIVEYETAFAWVFCAFNSLLYTLTLSSGGLARLLFSRSILFGIPPGPLLILFGNLAIGLFWLWRYRIAARGVRWSNF